MVNKQINDFDPKAPIVDADELLLQETGGGTNKKTTAATIKDYVISPAEQASVAQDIIDKTQFLTPQGFVDRDLSTLTWDDGTRQLTISPTVTSFDIMIKGVQSTKTAESIVIPDVSGQHFVYYDQSGTLVTDQTATSLELIRDYVYVANIFWSDTDGVAVVVGDERHGAVMDWNTHFYLHHTVGSAYDEGFGLGNFAAARDGADDADAQFSVADGDFHDEDIEHEVVDGSPQDLSPTAGIPILYRSGASGEWRTKTANTFPIIYDGTAGYTAGAGRVPWNEFTGATWQLTEVGNNNHVLVHYYATNDIRYPIVGIQGINEYATTGDAQAGALTELETITGIPFIEFMPIASCIFKTNGTYANVPNCFIGTTDSGGDFVDWRGTKFASGGGGAGDHGNLGGLGDDDHPQYAKATSNDQTVAESLGEINKEPTGFPNLTDSVVTFTDGTRTFQIAPTATSFDIYVRGVKYTKSSAQTVVIPDTEGQHFLYFDSTGTLVSTMVEDYDVLLSLGYCGAVYWDAVNAEAIYIGEERHGFMPWETHKQMHLTRGTQFISGLALGDFTADDTGNTDSHAQFSVSDGEILDEDLVTSPTDGAPQELSPIAAIPVYYKDGASALLRRSTTTNFPVKSFPAGRLAWNEFTGGAWQQTEVGNNNFVLSHIFATNDINEPIVSIQGEAQYSTLGTARLGATTEINDITANGLGFEEFVPIGTVIYQTSTSYSNTPKARVRTTDLGDNYVDFRGSELSPSSSASDHGNLSGLSDDDHTQYLRTDGGRQMTGALDQFKGADIASAATTDIGAATGNFAFITGTTTITGLGTADAGVQRTIKFAGALTLTYNATSLILPTAGNILTVANDRAQFISLGSGNWICTWYTRADGTPLAGGGGGGGFSSGFRAARTGTKQSIATATITKAQFGTEAYDGDGEYDPTTNYRFTATSDGKYAVHAHIRWYDFLAVGAISKIYIYKNGTSISLRERKSGASINDTIQINEILDLAASDYIEIFLYHNHGSNRQYNDGTSQNGFTAARIQ